MSEPDRTEVYEDKAGGWRWRRIAPNGEVIATGESYTRKFDALMAAKRVFEGPDEPDVEDEGA